MIGLGDTESEWVQFDAPLLLATRLAADSTFANSPWKWRRRIDISQNCDDWQIVTILGFPQFECWKCDTCGLVQLPRCHFFFRLDTVVETWYPVLFFFEITPDDSNWALEMTKNWRFLSCTWATLWKWQTYSWPSSELATPTIETRSQSSRCLFLFWHQSWTTMVRFWTGFITKSECGSPQKMEPVASTLQWGVIVVGKHVCTRFFAKLFPEW